MQENNSDTQDNESILPKDEVSIIWDEYKYRHEHIWKTVFSLTGAVVLLSVIPYLYPRVTCVLKWGTGVSLIIGIGLYLFGISRIRRELERFDMIKRIFRDHQYIKYRFDRTTGKFAWDVRWYLIGLGIVGFVNIGIFVFWVIKLECSTQ